ncbi:MAG: hypothetical protein HUU01_17755 [Saprospiraceae bacterium]|nr:hypothetical protein [Saprospiraceae bacterium]
MNPIVESYLEGELKGDELRQFEAELAVSPGLRKEVEEYGKIIRDLKRIALMNEIKAAGEIVKAQEKRKKQRWMGYLILTSLVVICAVSIRACQTRFSTAGKANSPSVIQVPDKKPAGTDSHFNPNVNLQTPESVPEEVQVSPKENKPIASNVEPDGSQTYRNFRNIPLANQSSPASKTDLPDSLFLTPAFQAIQWSHPVYTPLAKLLYQAALSSTTSCLPPPPKGAAPPDSLVLIKASCHLSRKEVVEAEYWFNRITGSPAFHTEALWGIAWCAIISQENTKARKYLREVIAINDPNFAPRSKAILATWKN